MAVDPFDVERLLLWAGFGQFQRVAGRLGIADVFDDDTRMGIYVLAFKDGCFYVGKATDVTSRYRNHRTTKQPIEAIAFRTEPLANLDRAEADTIGALELIGAQLTNIAMTRTGTGTVTKQNWASADAIKNFNSDPSWNDLSGPLFDNAEQRVKSLAKFRQLVSLPIADKLQSAFALYVKKCVPIAAQTAYHRWVISALPSGYRMQHLANLSIGWQWACVSFMHEGQTYMQVYGRGSVLKRAYGRGLESIDPEFCEAHVATEVAGGTDQLKLVCALDEFPALIAQVGVVSALREVAIDLMQRPTPYKPSHCFQLAEAIIGKARAL